MKHMKVD